jgi:hypothetical protein
MKFYIKKRMHPRDIFLPLRREAIKRNARFQHSLQEQHADSLIYIIKEL